jgi:hypothetical protein
MSTDAKVTNAKLQLIRLLEGMGDPLETLGPHPD